MRTVVLALVLVFSAPVLAQQGRALQHDPFARPSPGAVPGFKPAPGPRRAPPPAPPKLKLHGVMMAGPDSIANVEGMMVRIGESVQGYRLVAVHERAAVFEKDSATFTLPVGTAERK